MSFFKEPKRLTDDERSEIIESMQEKIRIAMFNFDSCPRCGVLKMKHDNICEDCERIIRT